MQFSVVFLAILALGAAIPQNPRQQAADHGLLTQQQQVIALLENIVGEIPNEELRTLGLTYDIEANLHNYVEPSAVRYVVGSVRTGNAQPKHTPLSTSISRLRREVALLHRILLGAKDYDTFLKTAAWIRVHCNEHQFVKALTAAILEREDTQGIILPPPYEVLPQYFFDSRIIQQVQNIKSRGIQNPTSGNVVDIPVNHTAHLQEGENKLAYWTQDIGLAAYYTHVSLSGHLQSQNAIQGAGGAGGVGSGQQTGSVDVHGIGHGARHYYLHQQLLARYNLERLSNGLGPIDTLVLDEEVQIPFKVNQRYTNGLEFPGRQHSVNLKEHNPRLLRTVQKLEKRIIDAIDSGSVLTPHGVLVSILNPQGLDILGNLIESSGKSINPRYYGSLVSAIKQLLGASPTDVTNIWDYTPSALELAETSVKDPAFYQLAKRILHLFEQYQQGLPHHVYNDVVLPGVSIEKVVVSPLITYFSDHKVSLDNAVVEPVGQEEESVNVRAQLKRLDHQPYQLQIVVQSDKTIQNAVVRVYVGPKYNHHGQHVDINKDRLAFVELDQFVADLVEGQNVIVRSSQQASGQSWDWPSIHAIKDSVDAAIRSQNPFYITEPQQIFGWPARLALPKGTQSGLPLQLLVVVSSQEQVAPESWVGIIPEEWQNYNQQTFQVVDENDYAQHVPVPATSVSPINTCSPSIAVVPHWEQKDSVPAAKWHYGYLYKRWPGHQSFPHWQQHHYQPGEGEGRHHLGLLNSGLPGVGQVGLAQAGVIQHLHRIGQGQVVGQVGQEQVVGQVPIVRSSIVHGGLDIQGQVPLGVGETVQGRHHGHSGRVIGHAGLGGLSHGVHGVHGQGIGSGIQGGIGGIHGIQSGIHGGINQGGILGGVQDGFLGGVQGGILGGIHSGVHSGVHSGIHSGVHVHHHGSGHYPVQHESVQGWKQHDEILHHYYENQPISHVIGGAISLDGRPLGWPLNRPLDVSALYAPNIHVTDVVVHHVDIPVNPVTGQEIYAN